MLDTECRRPACTNVVITVWYIEDQTEKKNKQKSEFSLFLSWDICVLSVGMKCFVLG